MKQIEFVARLLQVEANTSLSRASLLLGNVDLSLQHLSIAKDILSSLHRVMLEDIAEIMTIEDPQILN